MTVTVGHSAPHSAVETETDAIEAPNASVRAPAREEAESTAQSAPESAVTEGDWFEGVWAWFIDWITPPDIWTDGSKPLKDMWAYAARGEWTTKTGLPRALGKAYAIFFAMPLISALEYAKWIVERPSRHVAAWVLLYVLAQFPPVSWLI